MRINLDSAFFFVGQVVARHMIARRRGKIINIDSLKSEAARYLIALHGIKGRCQKPHQEQLRGLGATRAADQCDRSRLFCDPAQPRAGR